MDDQESMRKIISQMLQDNGYEVTTAVNGQEGLILFKKHPGEFDLVLADVNMPYLDGFQFLKTVKKDHPDQLIIFLTSMEEDVVETIGKEYKVDGIIEKPFDQEATLETIKQILNK